MEEDDSLYWNFFVESFNNFLGEKKVLVFLKEFKTPAKTVAHFRSELPEFIGDLDDCSKKIAVCEYKVLDEILMERIRKTHMNVMIFVDSIATKVEYETREILGECKFIKGSGKEIKKIIMNKIDKRSIIALNDMNADVDIEDFNEHKFIKEVVICNKISVKSNFYTCKLSELLSK